VRNEEEVQQSSQRGKPWVVRQNGNLGHNSPLAFGHSLSCLCLYPLRLPQRSHQDIHYVFDFDFDCGCEPEGDCGCGAFGVVGKSESGQADLEEQRRMVPRRKGFQGPNLNVSFEGVVQEVEASPSRDCCPCSHPFPFVEAFDGRPWRKLVASYIGCDDCSVRVQKDRVGCD
jgi:hypothetical protein